MTSQLTFVAPPPGLEPATDFVLEPVDGATGLFMLASHETPGVRLFVIDASYYLPSYSPTLSTEQSAALRLEDPDDAVVLVVTTPGPSGTTANLLAPIVVNSTTGAASQVILDDDRWPLHYALTAPSA